MKRLIIILVIVLAGYGLIMILRGPARSFTERVLGDAKNTEEVRGPSFSDDKDRDGLSDAKEHIYGSNPAKKDTDGDGYSDGEEAKKGYDPLTKGSSKVLENESLKANLTVQYFEWAREVGNSDDPQLNDEAVKQFLALEGHLQAKVPTIADNEMTLSQETGPEALKAYFKALAEIKLPDSTVSYLDLADTVISDKKATVIDETVKGLNDTYEAMRKVPAPREIVEVHRQQIALIKALRDLFSDLYTIDRDPVMLVRDITWGNDLLERSVQLERQRRDIAATIPQ